MSDNQTGGAAQLKYSQPLGLPAFTDRDMKRLCKPFITHTAPTLKWQSITITLVEKVQIIAVFLGSLFLVASISWLLWSALSPQAVWQRRDVLFQICYGMYGFMDLVCVGLIVHEGAAVYNVFMRWRAVNLHWDVQSYDKAKDMEETSTGHSSLAPRTLWLPLATFGPNGPLHPTQLGPQPWTCLCLAPFCP
ncbi:E3 ubiquitin-protein ligase MARCH11, partial [Lates japonicus]